MMTMLFGLVPQVLLVRRSMGADLRSGERGSSRTARGLYQGLVIAEVALACALLVGSVLLIRTVGEMTAVRLGVTGANVSISPVRLSLEAPTLDNWKATAIRHAELLDRIREQPGIIAAGSTNFLPLEHGWRNPVLRGDSPPVPVERGRRLHHTVSDSYFEAMGATIVAGRPFNANDSPAGEPVVIKRRVRTAAFFDRSRSGRRC